MEIEFEGDAYIRLIPKNSLERSYLEMLWHRDIFMASKSVEKGILSEISIGFEEKERHKNVMESENDG